MTSGRSGGEGGQGPQHGHPRAGTHELELVRRYLAGDERARREIGERLRVLPNVLRVLNRRAGQPLDEHELLDLVQDVAIVFVRKLGRFDGRGELDGWIYGVCRFEFLNASRSRRRRPRLADDLGLEELLLDADDPGDLERIAADIHAGLATLAPEERAVVEAKHFDDLSFEALGQRSGCSPNTVKTRYYRGLRKLRDFMQPRRKEYGR